MFESAKGYCLLGAIISASMNSYTAKTSAVRLCYTVLDARTAKGYHHSLIAWNDQTGRTKAEVLDLLREAAISK